MSSSAKVHSAAAEQTRVFGGVIEVCHARLEANHDFAQRAMEDVLKKQGEMHMEQMRTVMAMVPEKPTRNSAHTVGEPDGYTDS